MVILEQQKKVQLFWTRVMSTADLKFFGSSCVRLENLGQEDAEKVV